MSSTNSVDYEKPQRLRFVHHCAFCGWRRESASLTILVPACEACGCCLSSCSVEDFAREGLAFEQDVFEHERRADASGPFVLVAAGPFLLPVIGVRLGDLLFAIPFALLLFAAVHCLRTAIAAPRQRRSIWIALGVSAALASVSSLLAVVSSVAGAGVTAAFYLGATASVALLGAALALARCAVKEAASERLVEGVMFATLLLGSAVYFLIVPGFRHGDALLTAVVLIDLLALAAAVATLTARISTRHRHVAWAIVGVGVAASAGDGLVSAGAAGQIASSSWVTALLWALAGYFIAVAADLEGHPAPAGVTAGAGAASPEGSGARWIWGRVVLPLGAVLFFPAVVLMLLITNRLDLTAGVYFGSLFLAIVTTVFSRQAYLLVENRRAVVRERGLRSIAVRRGDELEALTGLATTMTESLEETPIMERGLGVLHLAARATSSALHAGAPNGTPRAVAGRWHTERVWSEPGADQTDPGMHERGGRVIVRLSLSARGHDIGTVTLMRGAQEPFTEAELGLLRLLVDQLGIAVQNARDYTEKLDQAIRDPLTGLYNRRFFYESLDKELHRTERYGSTVSVALFDVDDFKAINDSLGHSAGDDALRRISDLVTGLLRPTDSLARLGGEEFGLIMPETQQLDALLVAERLRTAISRTSLLEGRKITVSGGVATCPKDATTHDDLINRADEALYWAKRNGKNLCAIAGEVVLVEADSPGNAMIAHLHALVSTIDAHHLSTKDHSENVAAYAVAIGQALGLDSDHIVRLRRAAFLHDIGKVAVNRAILEKPGALTDEEWAEMKIHPVAGTTMLLHSGLPEEAHWIRHHHERIDGRGYPDGLAGELIPVESRILFVADAFEAMTSDRPYHRGIPIEAALEELTRCASTQFDPSVVQALVKLVGEDRLTVLAMHQDQEA